MFSFSLWSQCCEQPCSSAEPLSFVFLIFCVLCDFVIIFLFSSDGVVSTELSRFRRQGVWTFSALQGARTAPIDFVLSIVANPVRPMIVERNVMTGRMSIGIGLPTTLRSCHCSAKGRRRGRLSLLLPFPASPRPAPAQLSITAPASGGSWSRPCHPPSTRPRATSASRSQSWDPSASRSQSWDPSASRSQSWSRHSSGTWPQTWAPSDTCF